MEIRQDAHARLVFALLALAVFGQVLLASTPLPLGGPNVVAAVAAALVAAVLWLRQNVPLAREGGIRHALAAGLLRRFRPAIPAFLVAVAMWLWVLSVYLRTGTFDSMRVGQFTAGIGVMFAVLCAVSVSRAKMLVTAIVIATSISTLIGIGVLVVGKPFVDLWLSIANVAEADLPTVLLFGRTAGAAAHPGTLGYQLAVAIVLGLALLVLGAPPRRMGWGRLWDAVLFLLVTSMLAALVVNASRSTALGVVAGVGLCMLGVATAPRRRRCVRRSLVVLPLAAVILLAVFNPWINVGNFIEKLSLEQRNAGDISNLAVGDDALVSGDSWTIGHRFAGYEPGVAYEFRLRPKYRAGYGFRGKIKVTADSDGAIVVTWRRDPQQDLVGYQYRMAIWGTPSRGRWRDFVPTLRAKGITLALQGLLVGNAALTTDDPRNIAVELFGLTPLAEHDMHLRAVLSAEEGPISHVRARADERGVLVVAWRRSVLPHIAYQVRLRGAAEQQWKPWQEVVPSLPSSLRSPVWPGLRLGAHTLEPRIGAAERHEVRLGHAVHGVQYWHWTKVQIRERLVDGVERAPRHGEVLASPHRSAQVPITWPAPPVPEGVAGYQYRLREMASDWLPWTDFSASLSSKTPTLLASQAGWSVVQDGKLVRHTLVGLPAGVHQSVQLQARTVHGYGATSASINDLSRDDGSLVLAWRQPQDAQIVDVRFRLWSVAHRKWLLWQDLARPISGGRSTVDLGSRGRTGREALTVARTQQRIAGSLRLHMRLVNVEDSSARGRLSQTVVALRYALDHPFGPGVYRPGRQHTGEMSEKVREETVRLWPHNQFLHVLVIYGFPGLGLLLLFYALLVRAAWRAGRLAWREPRADTRCLAVGVIAAWVAYSVNSMLFPTGPFLQDWGHYFVLGLLLSLENLLANGGQPLAGCGGRAGKR